MLFVEWLSLALVCFLGAAMPGPSLAVVIQATARGGFEQGAIAWVSHAAGVAIYAVLTVTGLAVVMVAVPKLFILLQIAGALFLIYLAIKTLMNHPAPAAEQDSGQRATQSARDGFLMAFLNPKLLIFFTALFSQFIHAGLAWTDKGIMVATVFVIDGLWYCLVAFLLSRGFVQQRFSNCKSWLQRIFAVLLILVAGRLLLLQIPF